MTPVRITLLAAAAACLSVTALAAEARKTWDLTEMFPTPEAAVTARAAVERRLPELEACRGHLGDSAATLRRCLDLRADAGREFMRVFIYAYLGLDKDVRNAPAQKLKAETAAVGVRLSSATAWFEPELVALGKERIGRFLAEDKALASHAFDLHDAVRRAAHTLPAEQETLLAQVGLFSGKFNDIYDQLAISDLPYPEVELPGLGAVRLNQTGYIVHRSSPDRAVREKVFHDFWSTFKGYENTFGTVLNAEVQKNWFYAQARSYPSSLAATYDADNIPVEVYSSLIRDAHANLATLHRMLALRKRMLRLDDQKYSDIYVSIVPKVELAYGWDETKATVVKALAPLGREYCATAAAGLDSWVDVDPADGKQTGAYNIGRWYDGHPWILLNFDGTYDALSTTAHELGHAMHAYLANHAQPYTTAGYSGVVAEVASTFNETMLNDQLLKAEKDPLKRVFLLSNRLELLRATIFRQIMFAEFQLEIHARAERGETLTGEDLSALYLRLQREYHGHAQGIMRVDDLYGVEWAFIPHFYQGFYVWQYAAGLVAATALAEQVKTGQPGAVERYLDFLKAGGSDYPIELLKKAGCDLTTPGPFAATMRAANRIMDEIEALLPTVQHQA